MGRNAESGAIRIMTLMAKGVDSRVILDAREQVRRAKKRSDKRGLFSEERVWELILSLPLVRSVERVTNNHVKGLTDMFVDLDPSASLVARVGVQVKSSFDGIAIFRQEVMRRESLRDDQLDSWLLQNRIVVLHGQRREDIVPSFLSQVRRINTHAQMQQAGVAPSS